MRQLLWQLVLGMIHSGVRALGMTLAPQTMPVAIRSELGEPTPLTPRRTFVPVDAS